MNILYIGDIMGRPGRKIVSKLLPGLRIKYDIDVVIAQAENVSHGKGMSQKHFSQLEEAGIDGFSGGNHTIERQDTIDMVKSKSINVIAPANINGPLQHNFKIIKVKKSKVAIISLLGYTIPSGYSENTTNPLNEIDYLLPQVNMHNPNAIIVNIHGDVSSEKVMIGHYLDGKVTAVIGDHWHIPTADARVLANGSAHVTDVGMCGMLNSSLGVNVETAIKRWKGEKVKNRMEDSGALQFNAVLVSVDYKSKLAKSIERIQVYLG
jgi:2',3'-cyclic-nucleotide 2'-phosphodiesterase